MIRTPSSSGFLKIRFPLILLFLSYPFSSFASRNLLRFTPIALVQYLTKHQIHMSESKHLGEFCERLTIYHLKNELSLDKYKYYSNLNYFNENGTTAGELDIILENNENGQVDYVFEVKCQSKTSKAARNGRGQLERFIDKIAFMKAGIQFVNERSKKFYFESEQFLFTEYKVILPYEDSSEQDIEDHGVKIQRLPYSLGWIQTTFRDIMRHKHRHK